jgi:iron complex outermembrane recepter protein
LDWHFPKSSHFRATPGPLNPIGAPPTLLGPDGKTLGHGVVVCSFPNVAEMLRSPPNQLPSQKTLLYGCATGQTSTLQEVTLDIDRESNMRIDARRMSRPGNGRPVQLFAGAVLVIVSKWCLAGPAGGAGTAATSATPAASEAPASSTDNTATRTEKGLAEVVVTGSLIPTTSKELATPLTVISTEDLQKKGFADIAEGLQRTSYATGSIQGGQYAATLGFTLGAKVVSLFGLLPQYTKYLIDGRPIASYPALYNGTDIIVSISGVPTQLIDHLDILPGAQSSIYGSDAIAGVVNIVMKKNLDGPLIDGRYGWSTQGGNSDRRIAIGDGFTLGNLSVVAGAQYESLSPIWGFQRGPTRQIFAGGSTPQTASRDFLLVGLLGQSNGDTYYFQDPANCTNVSSLYGGTEHMYSRANSGSYCGTVNQGYYTIANEEESTQGYLHATLDVTDTLQVFADALINHDVVRFSGGILQYNSSFDSASPYAYYEDPNLNPDYLNLQRNFSPEEAGGLDSSLNKNTNNTIRGTIGVKGDIGSSNWKYVVDMTYSENKLTESTPLYLTAPIEAFFANVYGPQLGYDSDLGAYLYSPNYAAFYKPLTPAQFNGFLATLNNYSRTEESFARGQVTNTALFKLPGGGAGLALQLEGGSQGWDYAPDPNYFDGGAFAFTSTAGSGHRSHYAMTTELKLPLLSVLTADLSGRYDQFRVSGQNVDKATFNVGLQYRPVQMLLLRGRYGTAFKAPTLADEYEGKSGYYQTLNDYYYCATQGFTGSSLPNCPQFQTSIFGTTSGNTALRPITATVWDAGFILTPIDRLNITFDYIHWAIQNEVQSINPDTLLKTEAACRLGDLDANSPTCVQAIADVTRNSSGQIVSVYTPKENASHENLGVFTTALDYAVPAGVLGEFLLDGSFTLTKFHTFQQFPGDPYVNYLNDPFYSTEFKTKSNASVTWSKDPVSVTLYVERYGRSPNHISTTQQNGYSLSGAGSVAPWTLADLSVTYKPIPSLELTFATNNLFNRMPPTDNTFFGTETQPYNQFNYNVYGRTFYVTASYKPHLASH